MGVKKINRFHLINAGVMTGTATILSDPQNVSNFDNIGLEITWTGSAIGTISILGSNSGVNYYALTNFNSPLIQPNNNAGGYLVDINQFPWEFFKVQYVNSSSTGVLDVWLFSKDIN